MIIMESKKTIYFPKEKQIDDRIRKYMKGWSATEIWQSKEINIPDVFPVLYFEYIPDKIADREIQLILAAGWEGFDWEMMITLGLFEDDVLNGTEYDVIAEISRHGGTRMSLFYKKKHVVTFPKKPWWWPGEMFLGYKTVGMKVYK